MLWVQLHLLLVGVAEVDSAGLAADVDIALLLDGGHLHPLSLQAAGFLLLRGPPCLLTQGLAPGIGQLLQQGLMSPCLLLHFPGAPALSLVQSGCLLVFPLLEHYYFSQAQFLLSSLL